MSSAASEEVDAASSLRSLHVPPSSDNFWEPPSSDNGCVPPPSESNPSISNCCSYWQSTEAAKLFLPKNNETTLKAVEKQIEILKGVNKTERSYLNVLNRTIDEDTLMIVKFSAYDRKPRYCVLP